MQKFKKLNEVKYIVKSFIYLLGRRKKDLVK